MKSPTGIGGRRAVARCASPDPASPLTTTAGGSADMQAAAAAADQPCSTRWPSPASQGLFRVLQALQGFGRWPWRRYRHTDRRPVRGTRPASQEA